MEVKEQISKGVKCNNIDSKGGKLKNELFLDSFKNMQGTINFFYEKIKNFDQELIQVKENISKKLDIDKFTKKWKNRKLKTQEQFQEQHKNLEGDIRNVENKAFTIIQKFEKQMEDVEKNTIWKINDCNELLQKRVNEQYVQEALGALELKIRKLIQNVSGGEEQLEKHTGRLLTRIIEFEEQTKEKLKGLKKGQSDFEQNVNMKFVKRVELMEFEEKNEKFLNQVNEKDKKNDQLWDKNEEKSLQQDQKQSQLQEQLDQLQKKLNDYVKYQVSEEELAKYKSLLENMAPHQICILEKEIKILQEKFKGIESHIKAQGNLSDFNINNYPNFEQVRNIVQSMLPVKNNGDEEKLKKIHKDISELSYKVETVGEMERRVAKVLKELDVVNFQKNMKGKANEEDTKKEFFQYRSQISQLIETQNMMRKDQDSLKVLIHKMLIQQQISGGQNNSLIQTKTLNPGKCLSCGKYASHSTNSTSKSVNVVTCRKRQNSSSHIFQESPDDLNASKDDSTQQQTTPKYSPIIYQNTNNQNTTLRSLDASNNQSNRKMKMRPYSAKKASIQFQGNNSFMN